MFYWLRWLRIRAIKKPRRGDSDGANNNVSGGDMNKQQCPHPEVKLGKYIYYAPIKHQDAYYCLACGQEVK